MLSSFLKRDVSLAPIFKTALSELGHTPDATQLKAIEHFQTLHDALHGFRLRRPKTMGLYLWGGVGRGKTVMMDAFYETVTKDKARLHYHELLQMLLNKLAQHKTADNPLQSVIQSFAKSARLITIDDLHLHDIADGKLWQGVFQNALEKKLFLVVTSNYHPDQLLNIPGYQFKIRPVLEAMKQNMVVYNLDNGTDYRYAEADSERGPQNWTDDELKPIVYEKFEGMKPAEPQPTLNIEGREIHCLAKRLRTVWFDYSDLCGTDRSYRDYLQLSEQFDTIILSGVLCIHNEERAWVQRLVWLIDVLYDRNINLLLGSELPIIEMLNAFPNFADLPRTKSRLNQMLCLNLPNP